MFWKKKEPKTISDLMDYLLFQEEAGRSSWDGFLGDATTLPKNSPPSLSPGKTESAPTIFHDQKSSHYFWWGGLLLPITAARGHFLYVGTTNAGKSQLLGITLSQLLQTISPGSDRRAIIFDTKGDVMEILSGLNIPFTLMNINDKRAASWDLAKDCQSYTKADEISFIFIPSDKHGDPFWSNAARAIFSGVIFSFIYRHGAAWGLHDVVNALLSDKETLVKILSQFPQNQAVIDKLLSTEASKTEAGIQMQLFTAVKRLIPAAAHSQRAKKKFSLKDFLLRNDILVISPDLEARETVNPIAQAMLRRMTDFINASNDSDTRQTFVFIDEARFLGKLPGLIDLVTFGRSKGACVFISTQVVEGFYELYGKNETEEIFGNCNFKSILKANSPVTAQWATQLFGSVEVYETIINSQDGKSGLSVSRNKQRSKRERVLDSEILRLPLASREAGINAFFISPLTDGYKECISGEVIEELKPPKGRTERQISKPKEEEILEPWTKAERDKFLTPKREKAPPRTNEPIKSRAQESWVSDVESHVWEAISDGVAETIADYLDFESKRER